MTQLTKTEQTTDVLTAEMAGRVDRALSYHRGFHVTAQQQVQYAFLAGLELNDIKASLPHGAFMKFRETYLKEIAHRSATRYMAFVDQIGHVANLPTAGNIKLLENGELPEKERVKLLEAFHEVADGQTLTQLYRDTGIVRDPKPAAHHPRGPINAKEESAARQKRFERMAGDCAISMRALISEKLLLQSLPEDKLDELEDHRIELGRVIAKIREARKKRAERKGAKE